MPTLFDVSQRNAILSRIDALRATAEPRWGRMTAPEMVCHVTSGLRQALGEYDAGPPKGPLRYPPLNWLFIHVIPWPEGKAKSPRAFLSVAPTTWEADIATLRDAVQRFGDKGPDAGWPPSKVFGRISGRSWGVMQHKHLDHHLRQFGV